jgi:hypothetical protein
VFLKLNKIFIVDGYDRIQRIVEACVGMLVCRCARAKINSESTRENAIGNIIKPS